MYPKCKNVCHCEWLKYLPQKASNITQNEAFQLSSYHTERSLQRFLQTMTKASRKGVSAVPSVSTFCIQILCSSLRHTQLPHLYLLHTLLFPQTSAYPSLSSPIATWYIAIPKSNHGASASLCTHSPSHAYISEVLFLHSWNHNYLLQ